MSNMPLMIDLQNKKIVIVGGGKVATRRAKSLVEYCSHVHIVSPSITKNYILYFKALTIDEKMFEPQDISHAFLVIIATNQPEVNQHVKDSLPEGTLLNRTDASAGM